MKECKKVRINVKGHGVIYACLGDNLGSVLARHGFIQLPCGGRGLCGLCKVKVKGKVNPLTGNEKAHFLGENVRLACQVKILGDLTVEILYKPTIVPSIYSLNIAPKKIKPVVTPVPSDISPIVGGKTFLVEKVDWHDNLITIDNIVVSTAGDPSRILLIDLGTTKIAFQVINTNNELLKEGIHINPLQRYGSDVISLLGKVLDEDTYNEMTREIRKFILSLINENNAGSIFIAGNSVIESIFLHLPIENLAKYPFQPIAQGPFLLFLEKYPVIVSPMIGGFVGGDAFMNLIASIYMDILKPYMIIDLGTNTETILVTKEDIYATSTPAGPAFEGHVSKGSVSYLGGIYDVRIKQLRENGEPVFTYKYIGNPSGLLGSGIISLAAELLRYNLVDCTGRFRKGYRLVNGKKAFVIDKENDVYFTQKDIRELQKAIAAVKASWEILLRKAGIKSDDLEAVIITGTFGSYLSVDDVIFLGMIPPMPRDRVIIAGNLVLCGLNLYSLDLDVYRKTRALLKMVKYVNLAETSEFTKTWIESLSFKC